MCGKADIGKNTLHAQYEVRVLGGNTDIGKTTLHAQYGIRVLCGKADIGKIRYMPSMRYVYWVVKLT